MTDVPTRAGGESAWDKLRRRKAWPGDRTLLRELVIPFGSAGYVALLEIDGPRHVTMLAVRHQREDDYH